MYGASATQRASRQNTSQMAAILGRTLLVGLRRDLSRRLHGCLFDRAIG
jgi:hypothetical protein